MEYVYSALVLHSAGKTVDENGVKSVLKAAGVEVNDARVKALVAALEGVNIEDAISKAAFAAPAAAAPAGGAPAEGKKEEKKKEPEVSEEEAAAGLGALFG